MATSGPAEGGEFRRVNHHVQSLQSGTACLSNVTPTRALPHTAGRVIDSSTPGPDPRPRPIPRPAPSLAPPPSPRPLPHTVNTVIDSSTRRPAHSLTPQAR